MAVARLKKLGGSVSLTIPATLAREVSFEVDTDVNIDVENGALIIRRSRKRRTMREILAECDLTAPPSAELAAFAAAPAVGGEII